MGSVRKLHYCAIPGEDTVPVGTTLYRTSYAAAREFLREHPDFSEDQGSYFGKQVFIGNDTDKKYSVVIGTVTVSSDEADPKVLLEEHCVNQMVYRDMAYDDFVSGLPVLTVRKDNHERLITKAAG